MLVDFEDRMDGSWGFFVVDSNQLKSDQWNHLNNIIQSSEGDIALWGTRPHFIIYFNNRNDMVNFRLGI